ncbi:putative CoA-dependent acyltransferase [Legionella nautarum]|uniref:Putative CoA-dependent acyltransferase n=1 Tax=Legionella nautarum TaxID=45070 RepID=A0A0W0WLT3_9GAMM|nr:2-oxo acid dehydrogenase subunit E2 [Legionella nautarum]KTD33284.1 putative CoA-dependent acyltransferase [Legionella nautarum]
MDELTELLKPSWGSEKWILEGWSQISQEEKETIKTRLAKLFEHGLPVEIKHEKLFYIYAFSLLAQLEVLAIQIPLKFESQMTDPEHKKLMHAQLLDEIFHGLIFTKIVYQLCTPHSQPPAYSANVEILCNFIREQECPKVAVVLLNLLAEGWIEEIFKSCALHGIAPKVFETVLQDEQRHVCEADLYREIGLPDSEVIKEKIQFLENQLITNVFLQYKYMFAFSSLFGFDGMVEFLQRLDRRHKEQLNKINLKPSGNWQFLMRVSENFSPKVFRYMETVSEIEMSPLRKLLMTQWDRPRDPTMVGEFNLNVSCIDLFNKKYPPETLTTLILQTMSLSLHENESWRSYISYPKILKTEGSYVGIAVKLPDCGEQIATIVFENCHELTSQELATKIRSKVKMMVLCYKKREQLEKENPRLKNIMDNILADLANDFYGYPMINNSIVTLSNIGHCGYSQGKSPLRPNEMVKVTLFAVEKKPVWNNETKEFEPQDLLPISVTADHRIFDGNLPIPKMFDGYFQRCFAKMLERAAEPVKTIPPSLSFAKFLDQMISTNIDLGYEFLMLLQTYWLDFLDLEEMFNMMFWLKKETSLASRAELV